ncbi:hypothetical protein TPY_0062 [Sulfobacillus acidophilus TPY]|nr:hypothetical protein TPY_0062 [Sulfobacillus acidophilus TPY]
MAVYLSYGRMIYLHCFFVNSDLGIHGMTPEFGEKQKVGFTAFGHYILCLNFLENLVR